VDLSTVLSSRNAPRGVRIPWTETMTSSVLRAKVSTSCSGDHYSTNIEQAAFALIFLSLGATTMLRRSRLSFTGISWDIYCGAVVFPPKLPSKLHSSSMHRTCHPLSIQHRESSCTGWTKTIVLSLQWYAVVNKDRNKSIGEWNAPMSIWGPSSSIGFSG
jgi:hypothetical protein